MKFRISDDLVLGADLVVSTAGVFATKGMGKVNCLNGHASASGGSHFRPGPIGSSSSQSAEKTWRRSKLESPRSAARSWSSCATTAAPPPIEEASSMDLP